MVEPAAITQVPPSWGTTPVPAPSDQTKTPLDQAAVQLICEVTCCDVGQAALAVRRLIAAGWSPPAPSTASAALVDQAAEAAEAAALPLWYRSKAPLLAYTDGACSGNPGPGGWAVVLSRQGRVLAEYSGGVRHTTNNQMELTAVLETLRRVPAETPLTIVTDSALVIGWLTKGWKRNNPVNAALCQQIDALLAGRTCRFDKVGGHRGDLLNERADRLAVTAALNA